MSSVSFFFMCLIPSTISAMLSARIATRIMVMAGVSGCVFFIFFLSEPDTRIELVTCALQERRSAT